MNYTNGGYFCKHCKNYIPKDELSQHEQFCKSFVSTKKNQYITEFDYKEMSNNTNINQSSAKSTDDYYNLSDAMITFGKNPTFIQSIDNPDAINTALTKNNFANNDNINVNIFKKAPSLKNMDKPLQINDNLNNCNNQSNKIANNYILNEETDKNLKEERYNIIKKHSDFQEKLGGIPLYNKIGENNSFLIVVIQSIWNMRVIRNFILNDMNIRDDYDKHTFLINLRALLKNYQQSLNLNKGNSPLNIDKVRKALCDLFVQKRKFLPELPDDPVDLYYVIINLFHSHYINSNLCEINDSQCNLKCLAHKYFWMDLSKQDECECRGKVKRLYSYHNYIFDIPLDKINEITSDPNSLESFKLTFKGVNDVSLNDLKGKLFLFLKILINKIKLNCPEKGVRCSINQVYKQFYIANLPYYLTFNLTNPSVQYNSSMEVLRTLVLIPRVFDLASIFEHSNKQKVYYELIGGICSTNYKSYSCFFNQKNKEINDWVFYEDESILYFKEYLDIIKLLIKIQHSPIFLIYKIFDKNSESLKEISPESILRLERLANNIDSYNINNKNIKFRPFDDIIRYDNMPDERSQNSNLKRNNGVANHNSSTNNSSIASETSEYTCVICYHKNKVENKICLKCKKNNESLIKDILLLKRKSSEKTNSVINNIAPPFNNNPLTNSEKDSNDSSFKINELSLENKISSIKHNKNTIEKLVNPFENHVKIVNSSSKPKILIPKNSTLNSEGNTISSDSSKRASEKVGDTKNINMPKQVISVDKFKIKEESINKKLVKLEDNPPSEDLCKKCNRDIKKYKCICGGSLENENKKLDRTALKEDRIKPYKIEDKSVIVKNVRTDEWQCELCDHRNLLPNYTCSKCLDINRVLYEKYKQKEFLSNQKELVINDRDKDRESIKPRGYSEKKNDKSFNEVKNTNNTVFKREDSTSKLNVCKCKYDEDNVANYNIVCKTCKKRRPERVIKTNKEISANIHKLTQELNVKVDDKSKKPVTQNKSKYIGDDSFSKYYLIKENRSSSHNTNIRDSKAGNIRYNEDEKISGSKKQISNNACAQNYNSLDPRLNSTKKKI